MVVLRWMRWNWRGDWRSRTSVRAGGSRILLAKNQRIKHVMCRFQSANQWRNQTYRHWEGMHSSIEARRRWWRHGRCRRRKDKGGHLRRGGEGRHHPHTRPFRIYLHTISRCRGHSETLYNCTFLLSLTRLDSPTFTTRYIHVLVSYFALSISLLCLFLLPASS